jgi:hypothetical protein
MDNHEIYIQGRMSVMAPPAAKDLLHARLLRRHPGRHLPARARLSQL